MPVVEASLKLCIPTNRVKVVGDKIEVSLDCDKCCRTSRTVIFFPSCNDNDTSNNNYSKKESFCCPGSAGGSKHKYNGDITSLTYTVKPFTNEQQLQQLKTSSTMKTDIFEEIEINYLIQYDCKPFKDKKYDYLQSGSKPSWLRIHYIVSCTSCNEQIAKTTQTNVGSHGSYIKCSCKAIACHTFTPPTIIALCDALQ